MAYIGKSITYTPIEYIESSGTQYIDAQIKPSNNTKILAEGYFTNNGKLFGCGIAGSYMDFGILYYSSNYAGRVRNGATTNGTASSSIAVGTTNHTFELSQTEGFKIDNTLIGTFATYTFQSAMPMYIFAWNATNKADEFAIARLKSFKIYESGTLVRDFVPAIDENNVACFFEQVENRLYYNKGTGTFVAGNAVGTAITVTNKSKKIINGYVGKTETYTLVEYLESSGTQYIDTCLTLTGFHIKIELATSDFTTNQQFTGVYYTPDSNRYFIIIRREGTSDRPKCLETEFGGYSGDNFITTTNQLALNTKYTIEAKLFNGEQYLKLDDTTIGTKTITGLTLLPFKIFLLANNDQRSTSKLF